MLPLNVLLSFILTSFVLVDASPLGRRTGKVTLDFATKINTDGMLNIVDKDRARAQAFRNIGQTKRDHGTVNVKVTNTGVAYTAQVGIGDPATYYTLEIDTGTTDTWVKADIPCTPTSSSKDTGNTLVSYGSSKKECTKTLTLAPSLVIMNQTIGVGGSGTGFDGVLGLDRITPTDSDTTYTVMDNLYSQERIPEEVLGIYFIPASESSSGTLTFGGYDDSAITSSVNYVPLTTTSPASNYWGIDQSISYGGAAILQTTVGIVDTATTLILIATDAFKQYQSATGGTLDPATGLLAITLEQYANLKTLSFNIGGISYDLSSNAQIWPRSLNAAIGGNPDSIYLVVSDIGSQSGSGLDFINGYTFLERYYSVFDTDNERVGFASTAYTDSTSN